MKRLSVLSLLAAFAGLSAPSLALAGAKAPRFTVSGYLTDTAGNAVTTEVKLTARLYDDKAAATSAAFLTESFTLTPDKDGFFALEVGSTVTLDPAKFDIPSTAGDPNLYLGLQVGDEGEMSPRFKLNSAPWALSVDWTGVTGAPDFSLSTHTHAFSAITDAPAFAPETHTHAFADLTSVPADLADGDQGVTLAKAPLEVSTDGKTVSLATTGCAGGQVLKFNGTTFVCDEDVKESGAGGGTVTSVTASAPLSVALPSSTPQITLPKATGSADGYLSAADWAAFNAKGPGTVTSVTGTAPVAVATGTSTPVVSMAKASATANGYLSSADWTTFNAKGAGTVTNVTATAPLSVATGTSTPALSISQANGTTSGFLSAADWATFNGKQAAITATAPLSLTGGALSITKCAANQILKMNAGATAFVCAADTVGTVTNVTGTAPVTVTNGTSTPAISMAAASGSANGYLSSADWTTFNGKAPASGSANYVQNTTTQQASSSFNVSGTGAIGSTLLVGGTVSTGLGGPTNLKVDGLAPAFLAGSDAALGFNTYSAGGSTGWTYAVADKPVAWIALGVAASRMVFGVRPPAAAGTTFNASDASTLLIASDGKVGIGAGITSATLSQALHVVGDAYKTVGGDSWALSSDLRLKQHVAPLSNSLERMLALRGVSFEWRDPAKYGGPGRHMGFIAQEVEAVLPEWVYDGPDGYKVLATEGFNALAVESMRELKQENDALRSQVQSLEKRLAALEKLAASARH